METKMLTWSRRVFWGVCAGVIAYASYLSRAQFMAWHASERGMYLVPPYRPIGYFIRYAFVHFWLSYAISFAVAMLFFVGAKWLNARRGEMLFEREEFYFLATGLVVSGHPGWIFYLLVVFAAHLLASLVVTFARGVSARVSFYYFWLPCAAVTVILHAHLMQYAWYGNLMI